MTDFTHIVFEPHEPFDAMPVIALGGSGVSHFDIRWITQYLPNFARLLYRSTVDVGVIRRFIEHVVIEGNDLLGPKPELTHRALDDAHAHLREAMHYRRILAAVELEEQA